VLFGIPYICGIDLSGLGLLAKFGDVPALDRLCFTAKTQF